MGKKPSVTGNWIKLNRSLLKWEWYDNHHTTRLFIHILLKAAHAPNKWRKVTVPAGSCITGRKKLAKETGMSERNIRTSLKHLQVTNEVTIKTTSKYSIISVVNWEKWQTGDQQSDTQSDTQSDHQSDHKQEREERKEDKNIYSDEFLEFWNAYPRKVGKGAASKAYRAIKAKPPKADILNAVVRQAASSKWQEESGRWIPHPQTWLNQRRWEDEETSTQFDWNEI